MKKGSMDKLKGDDRSAATRGVPGAFGKKDEDTHPASGDKQSAIQRGKDPFEAGKWPRRKRG